MSSRNWTSEIPTHHHHHHHHNQQHHSDAVLYGTAEKGAPCPSSNIRKSTSLSNTILDYYHKYGQNRDLEKYFRFRRSKSSSDSDFHDSAESRKPHLGKSLENLSILNASVDEKDAADLKKSRSNDSLEKSSNLKTAEESAAADAIAAADDAKKADIKIHSKKELRKKTYNFSMESNIEISLAGMAQPTETSQSLPTISSNLDRIQFETSETQTDASNNGRMRQEYPNTPLKPLEKQIEMELPRPLSAASSATSISNKQRLEWDSLADVGYDEKSQNIQPSSLTTFEKSTLKKFFADRGVSFDENMIIIAAQPKSAVKSDETPIEEPIVPKQTENRRRLNKEKWENAFRKILDEKYNQLLEQQQQPGKQPVPTTTTAGQQLWESALRKFRQKYGTPRQDASSSQLSITDPKIHSTPIVPTAPDTSKGAIPKRSRQSSIELAEPKVQLIEYLNNYIEKSCQTSQIGLASKECQVERQINVSRSTSINFDLKTPTDRSSTTEDSEYNFPKANSSATDGHVGLISAASFEFIAPNAYGNVQPADKAEIPPSPVHESDKENHLPPAARTKQKQKILIGENKENVTPGTTSSSSASQSTSVQSKLKADLDSTANTTTDASLFENGKNLEEDLKKGVELLTSLVDSSRFDKKYKKKMIKKVVHQLLKAKYASDTQTTSDMESINQQSATVLSGIDTLRSSTSSTNKTFSKSSKSVQQSTVKKNHEKPSNDEQSAMKYWLPPMTHSELDYERHLQLDKTNVSAIENNKQKEMADRLLEAKCDVVDQEALQQENILKIVTKGRNSQLNWIEREINHLVNLKEFLISEKKKREMDIMEEIIGLDKKKGDSAQSNYADNAGYENIKVSSVNGSSGHSGYVESCRSAVPGGHSSSTSTNIASTTKDSRKSSLKQTNSKEKGRRTSLLKNQSETDYSAEDWNSHINMQYIARNRTKLKTPQIDEVTTISYARAKQKDFIDKYETVRSKMQLERPIYTQPYSTDHYSEPRDTRKSSNSKKITNDAYTSITGSDIFLSSNSVSIPVANSTSNTTTHQYDTRTSIAIQTSDSMLQTRPIYGHQADDDNRRTIRVHRMTSDKQQQVLPESIAYILSFDDLKEKQRKNSEKKTISYEQIDNCLTSESYGSAEPATSEQPVSSLNSIYEREVPRQIIEPNKQLTLQQQLTINRPDFMYNAKQRQTCLNELNILRQKRNEQRNRLFQLSSTHSLRQDLHNKIIPPPISTRRIFTTKALKESTRNRYNKLPEILRKEEIERQNRLKQSNRIVTALFNQNLKRRVLRGQTNLSNSISVAPI